MKLVDGLASDLDDTGDAEKVAQVSNLLKNEIRQNRLLALNYLKDMHEQYPEVTSKLLKEYDMWWNDISVRFDEYSDIVINSDGEILPEKLVDMIFNEIIELGYISR